MTVGHALQDVSEPGKGLDVVELCGGDEGADGCPPDATAVRAREPLDRVVVEFDTAVIEESGEGWPTRERVADGLGEGAGGWNAAKLHLEPGLHHLDEWPGAGVTHMPTFLCRAAPDRTLDRIEFGDPPQGLGGDR